MLNEVNADLCQLDSQGADGNLIQSAANIWLEAKYELSFRWPVTLL